MESSQTIHAAQGRAHCYRCDKVLRLCLCATIKRVPNRTRITIVQHPRERRHAIGTARIARLALENHAFEVAYGGKVQFLDKPGESTALLFPGPDVPSLESLAPRDYPDHLVVIDGTWPHARAIIHANPALQSLRRVGLGPGMPSNYRIRREPNAESISTIEAIYRALHIIESDTQNIESLIQAFDAMIDAQIAESQHATPRKKRTRQGQMKSQTLCASKSNLIFLHVEFYKSKQSQTRYPLRLSFYNPQSNSLNDYLLKSGPPPSPLRIAHLGLKECDLSSALSEDALIHELGTFLGDHHVVVAWPHAVQGLLKRLKIKNRVICLKHLAANSSLRSDKKNWGDMNTVLRDLGVELPNISLEGRAGPRLAGIWALSNFFIHDAPPADNDP